MDEARAQCRHSLSATNLGRQYVLRTQASLGAIAKLQPHFLCAREKRSLLEGQRERARVGSDKAKAARRAYRGQGSYVEELFA